MPSTLTYQDAAIELMKEWGEDYVKSLLCSIPNKATMTDEELIASIQA